LLLLIRNQNFKIEQKPKKTKQKKKEEEEKEETSFLLFFIHASYQEDILHNKNIMLLRKTNKIFLRTQFV
jgi:hypothetical protein